LAPIAELMFAGAVAGFLALNLRRLSTKVPLSVSRD
jgi:hypothetical protein